MHCGLCRKEGHKRDKCPDKHLYPEHSKGKKGGTKEKQPAPEPMEEESAEVHLQEQEILTGEDDLMNETMAEMETSVAQEAGPSKGMKFVRHFFFRFYIITFHAYICSNLCIVLYCV